MGRDTLTGSRIRERRMILGVRQAELARKAGISASYLNLIEHNRRRIGGKLLVDLAQVLGVEPSMLSEGAEAALVASLREAAAESRVPTAELDRVEEFAGRFPGWAEVLAGGYHRIARLERTVEVLSDRLTHDPHLAASLHEVLSTAAAIRSTASILAEPEELEAEWLNRFHKNLNEDSLRLAESSRALVNFLDQSAGGKDRPGVPQEEAEEFCLAHEFHFPELEAGTASPEDLIATSPLLVSDAAKRIARAALIQYQEDALALPLEEVAAAIKAKGLSPDELAAGFGCSMPRVLRRLAGLPAQVLGSESGLVICDGSGSILFRKPLEGFALPRFGASCPLWPIYSALRQPLVPLRRQVVQQGRSVQGFECYAVSWNHVEPRFEADPLYRAVMLVLPQKAPEATAQVVGASCRICPVQECPARREPSILKEEF